jgi:hypothetical protein
MVSVDQAGAATRAAASFSCPRPSGGLLLAWRTTDDIISQYTGAHEGDATARPRPAQAGCDASCKPPADCRTVNCPGCNEKYDGVVRARRGPRCHSRPRMQPRNSTGTPYPG